jgi:hypothetical protein
MGKIKRENLKEKGRKTKITGKFKFKDKISAKGENKIIKGE